MAFDIHRHRAGQAWALSRLRHACPGQQGPVRPRPDRSPFPFLWKLLSDHGKRCVIIDAFLTCPLQGFNGSQIVDWGSWSHFWETTIIPDTLKRELEKRFGRYPAEDHSKVGMVPPSDFQGFHQRLLSGVAKKTEAVKWLLEPGRLGFFFGGVCGVASVGTLFLAIP